MKKRKYKLTVTHNPQDLYNGIEPPELSYSYTTDDLAASVDREIDGGYQVIVTKAEGD